MEQKEIEIFLQRLTVALNLSGAVLVTVAANGESKLFSTLPKATAAQILGDVAIQIDDTLNVIIQG